LWVLLLGLVILVRPHLFPLEVVLPEGVLPSPGQVLELPKTIVNAAGETIRPLAANGTTLFLVTWAGCPACKDALEDGSFHDLLQSADEVGLVSRTTVIPVGPEDTKRYLVSCHSCRVVT